MGNSSTGPSISDIVAKERQEWGRENLRISEHYQRENLPLVKNFKVGIAAKMMFVKRALGPIEYKHFFITNGSWIIEFGGGEFTDNIVSIRTGRIPDRSMCEKEFVIADEHLERMSKVVGATGYSVLLRNCEHVAYFIYCGCWQSRQTVEGAVLWTNFKDYFLGHSKKQLNTFPVELRGERFPREIYPGENGFLTLIDAKKEALDAMDRLAYNVALIGPTGSGKSSLTNHQFNKTVALSGAQSRSVTRGLHIYQGQGIINHEARTVNIVDTIGLCDSELSPHEVEQMILAKLKAQDVPFDRFVFVVSDRLQSPQVKSMRKILAALRFGQYGDNFVFVYNKADQIVADQSGRQDERTLQANTVHMAEVLETGSRQIEKDGRAIDLNFHLGIPPTATYQEAQQALVHFQEAVFTDVGMRVPLSSARNLTSHCFLL